MVISILSLTNRSVIKSKMSPRTEEQFAEIRNEKRSLIMTSALELFANDGYHTTSISRIAKKAGISKGLLYNYFESKEALLIALLDKGFNEMMQYFDPNKDGVLETEEMEYFINKTFDSLVENIEFWRFYFRISFQAEVLPIVKEKISAILDSTKKMLVAFFEKRGSNNAEMEAMLFGALIDGVSMNYVFSPELIPIEEIKKAIIKKYC